MSTRNNNQLVMKELAQAYYKDNKKAEQSFDPCDRYVSDSTLFCFFHCIW